MLIEEHVYLTTDNVIALALRPQSDDITHVNATTDDVVQATHSHPAITQVKLYVNAIVGDSQDSAVIIDSATNSSWFDFTDPEIMKMKLGGATLKPGRHITQIKVFEAATPLGVIWGEIMLVVHQ